MARTSRLLSTVSTLALGAMSVLAGCVDNTVSVFIQQATIPQNTGTMCTNVQDPTMPGLNEGIMDLSLTDSYTLRPLIRSELIARRDGLNFRPETNTVEIQGYVIEIHEGSPTGPAIGPAFTVYQTVYIPPGSGGAPSYGVTAVQVIPPVISNMIKTDVCRTDTRPRTMAPGASCPVPFLLSHTRRLIVKMTAFGTTTGGVSIQTPEFDFPVNVCCHCLVTFPPDSVVAPMTGTGGTGHNSPNCLNGTAATTVASCAVGQDFPVDCRLCSGNNIVCQPNGFNPDPAAPANACPTQ